MPAAEAGAHACSALQGVHAVRARSHALRCRRPPQNVPCPAWRTWYCPAANLVLPLVWRNSETGQVATSSYSTAASTRGSWLAWPAGHGSRGGWERHGGVRGLHGSLCLLLGGAACAGAWAAAPPSAVPGCTGDCRMWWHARRSWTVLPNHLRLCWRQGAPKGASRGVAAWLRMRATAGRCRGRTGRLAWAAAVGQTSAFSVRKPSRSLLRKVLAKSGNAAIGRPALGGTLEVRTGGNSDGSRIPVV